MTERDRAEVRAEILRNARAAENERLRNEARRRFGAMSDAELAERVRELIREKASGAGRKGAAVTRQRADVGRRVELNRDKMLAHAQIIAEHVDALLVLVRSLCLHEWPDDLDDDPDAACGRCGLLYLEWTAHAGVAA